MKKEMTTEEMKEARDRISLKDKDHLKKWLIESGRKYLIFNSSHFVDALSMEDLEVFQQLLLKYKNYRNTIPTGRYSFENNPITGEKCAVTEMYDELLDPLEFENLLLTYDKGK